MSNVINGEIERLALELVRSVRDYRRAQEAWAAAREGLNSTDRTIAAPANLAQTDAFVLGKWKQGEVTALGAALAGLCLSQMGEPR